MTTYQALLTVARVAPLEEKETTDDYLKRLVLQISGLPYATFEALPEDARGWFETAADALSAGTKLAPPDGFDREAALAAPSPPTRITRPSGSAYVPIVHVPTSPPPSVPRPGQEPVRDTIIKLLIAEPDLSADGLMRRLADHHIKISTMAAQSQRGFAVSVLRLVREAGWRPPSAA